MVRTDTSLAEDNLEPIHSVAWRRRLSCSSAFIVVLFLDIHAPASILLTVFRSSPKEDNAAGKGGTVGNELAKGVGKAEELGVWTSSTGEWTRVEVVVEEVMILRPGGDVAVGVGELELERQSDGAESSLDPEEVYLFVGGVCACDDEENEVKKESVDVNDEAEFRLVSFSRMESFPFPSLSSSSLLCWNVAEAFLSFVSLVITRNNPACVLATTGAAADEQLKLITLPFPPTFRPLPTTPSGMAAAMGTTFRWEGLVCVAIVIALPVALRPGAGPIPSAALRPSGLE